MDDTDLFGFVGVATATPATTVTCRACEARTASDPDGVLLCDACRIDPAQTRASIDARIRENDREQEAVYSAWQAVLLGMPEPVMDRWAQLQAARHTARTALDRAERGARRVGQHSDGAIERAQADMAHLQARIARTAADPANPLAPILAAEQRYERDTAAVRVALLRLMVALQELDALEGAPL